MEDGHKEIRYDFSEEKNGNPEKKERFCKINKEMLPYKMHYFLFIGGMAATLPYLSAFGITRLGLTASNLAVASTIQQLLFLVAKPLIGYLTDYFNKLKSTIVALTLLQATFTFIFFLIPSTVMLVNKEYSLNSSEGASYSCDTFKDYNQITKMISGNHFDDYMKKNVESCLRKADGEVMITLCPDDCINGNHLANTSYKISKRKCSNLHDQEIISSFNSSEFTVINVFYIFEPRNYSTVCVLPEREKFELESHCYNVIDLELDSLDESFFDEDDCNALKKSPKDKNIATISSENFRKYQFWMYTVCVVIISIFISSLFTMSDTACYESIQGVNYGRQRAWGAISWGLIAPIAGFLNDYTDSYLSSWGLMVLLCSLQIWNLSRMDLVKPDFTRNILKDIKAVFSSMEFIAFVGGVFMNGFFTGIIWFYLTWFLISIGGNKLIIGLAHTSQCYLGEAPIMFISDWLVKKLGHFNTVTLAIVCHGVRFFLYSFLHNPWWILLIEILHGFTFGSFLTAMTSYAKLKAKPGLEATTQSVLACTYEGLGAGLGCLITGVCFDLYGSHTTFFYTAILCGICSLINIVFTVAVKFRKNDEIEHQAVETKDIPL